jgi:ribosomal protein S20
MSKYKEVVIEVLSKTKIKSTNEVLNEVQKKVDKIINWHLLHRVLMDLMNENKAERLESKAGFFWRKK